MRRKARSVRFTNGESAEIEAAAEALGVGFSTLVRNASVTAARRVREAARGAVQDPVTGETVAASDDAPEPAGAST